MLKGAMANQAAAMRGQMGMATPGLKEPGMYQWPKILWWMAAEAYQPSSVNLDQSAQGEWLGKSAPRWRKVRA